MSSRKNKAGRNRSTELAQALRDNLHRRKQQARARNATQNAPAEGMEQNVPDQDKAADQKDRP